MMRLTAWAVALRICKRLRKNNVTSSTAASLTDLVYVGDCKIVYHTRLNLRICDTITIHSDNGHNVWLPLIPRLLVRRAYRAYVLRKAREQLGA